MDDDRELVGEVSKNTLEVVKVHVSRFRGRAYVDARIFAQDQTASVATKKGLCLAPDVMLELLPLLAKAQERAAAAGGARPEGRRG